MSSFARLYFSRALVSSPPLAPFFLSPPQPFFCFYPTRSILSFRAHSFFFPPTPFALRQIGFHRISLYPLCCSILLALFPYFSVCFLPLSPLLSRAPPQPPFTIFFLRSVIQPPFLSLRLCFDSLCPLPLPPASPLRSRFCCSLFLRRHPSRGISLPRPPSPLNSFSFKLELIPSSSWV